MSNSKPVTVIGGWRFAYPGALYDLYLDDLYEDLDDEVL